MESANLGPTITVPEPCGVPAPRLAATGRAVRCLLIRPLLLITALMPMAGLAQDISRPAANGTMPHCGPQMDGQVSCTAGMLYECQFVSPNSMERRTGWRWKSDILRACPEPERVKPEQRFYVAPLATGCGGRSNAQVNSQGSTQANSEATPPAAGTSAQSRAWTMHVHPGGC